MKEERAKRFEAYQLTIRNKIALERMLLKNTIRQQNMSPSAFIRQN